MTDEPNQDAALRACAEAPETPEADKHNAIPQWWKDCRNASHRTGIADLSATLWGFSCETCERSEQVSVRAEAPAPTDKDEALHPRAVQIAQWLAATGWIEPEEEGDIARDFTLSFPPCERNEFLPQARLLELCAEFGIADADALKHRLEDWARLRAAALAPSTDKNQETTMSDTPRFIPHGQRCQADDSRGSDFGQCAEGATATVKTPHGSRWVCDFHAKHWPTGAAPSTDTGGKE